MAEAWDELEQRMREVKELRSAAMLLAWDQETYLPAGGSQARGRQIAAVEGVIHERLCAPRLGELLERFGADRSLPVARAAMVRQLGREAARARKLPARWVRAWAEAQSAGLAGWREARQTGRFQSFAPKLDALLVLRREQADLLGHGGTRYDALLELYEPGTKLADIEPLFARLAPELRNLSAAIAGLRRPSQRAFVGRRFDETRQWEWSLSLISAMGFSLETGRLDRSAHPFSLGIHPTDVRLTNRYREDDPLPATFGAIHECGHGLYEQGFDPAYEGTSIAEAASFGLHESQSRLWENLIGRSLPFWRAFFPLLKSHFPEALTDFTAERFHAAVNEVRPNSIRVEADEVHYNLHIALRLKLEVAMICGDLQARDLPGAWNEASEELLGFEPKSDVEGVLQDIHWAWGEIGYFPTYTLGNLYSAVLLRALERDLPALWDEVGKARLLPVRDWLRQKIHGPAHLRDAEDTVRAATGEGLTERPFVEYLWKKYGDLYGVKR
jgi:carboxypeptidase Taq